MVKILALTLALLPLWVARAEKVTYSQIMHQFGRAVRILAHLAESGARDPGGIKGEDIERAHQQVQLAYAFAELPLLPASAEKLSGEERSEYAMRHQEHMRNFAAMLSSARALLCELRLNHGAVEKYRELLAIEKALLDMANFAHSDLFTR